MTLPDSDAEYLSEKGVQHQIVEEANMLCLVIPGYVLPEGYGCKEADLLIRLSPGFPDVPPDMWWFSPEVRLADGRSAPATEVVETHLNRQWQRWSRHLSPDQWLPGRDSLESYLAVVGQDLALRVLEPVA